MNSHDQKPIAKTSSSDGIKRSDDNSEQGPLESRMDDPSVNCENDDIVECSQDTHRHRNRPAKRQKPAVMQSSSSNATLSTVKTPDITSDNGTPSIDQTKTPTPAFHYENRKKKSIHSSDTALSDVSSTSSDWHTHRSPVPHAESYESFIDFPPAPPTTPASSARSVLSSVDAALATPVPFLTSGSFANAYQLERQQQLYAFADGAETPAPTKSASASSYAARHDPATAMTPAPPSATRPSKSTMTVLPDDFSDWAVGDRYKLIRMLGRGSYGEVAQALDLYAGRDDAFVAIKRIQSPFDQEVDSIRLYREIHILRRIRGHACIIQLQDVVQPPTDDLDDFHDLYLVFECKLFSFYK